MPRPARCASGPPRFKASFDEFVPSLDALRRINAHPHVVVEVAEVPRSA